MDLFVAIQGDARLQIEHLTVDEIDSKDGIDRILKVLDPAFKEWDLSRQQEVDTVYEYVKRKPNESIRAYINRYTRIEMECKRAGTDFASMLSRDRKSVV